MKYREIVYDILSDLQQVYDDKKITEYHVLYWVTFVANAMIKGHLDNEYARTGQKSGQYLTVFENIPVKTSEWQTKYIEVPGVFVDMDFQRGIEYITYGPKSSQQNPNFFNVVFSLTTPARARMLNASHEKPAPDNPYYYVVGGKILFLGIGKIDVPDIEMGLYLGLDPRKITDLDEECPLPVHLVEQLKYKIVNLGRFVMSIPADNVNDGKDTNVTPQPKQQVNEQQ